MWIARFHCSNTFLRRLKLSYVIWPNPLTNKQDQEILSNKVLFFPHIIYRTQIPLCSNSVNKSDVRNVVCKLYFVYNAVVPNLPASIYLIFILNYLLVDQAISKFYIFRSESDKMSASRDPKKNLKFHTHHNNISYLSGKF